MSGKKLGALIGAIVLLFVAAYFGSPFWAASRLQSAAVSGDVDRIEAAVDFPAVRESMKSQLNAALTAKMQNDPEMKGNPFSGFAAMMIPTVVNNMVDAFVTADGVTRMVKRAKVEDAKKAKPAVENPDVDYSYAYRSIDRFAVSATAKGSKEEGPKFILERRGLFTWKMVRIEVPEDVFADRK